MTTPNTGTTSQGNGGEPAGGAQAAARSDLAPREVVVSKGEKNSLVMRLAGEHGSVDNAALHLAGRVIRYQKRAQEAERQAAAAKKLVPPADAVVLTGDEAKAITELRNQKVDLAKLPTTIKESSELRTQVALSSRKSDLVAAAGKEYKVNVLSKLLGDTPDGKVIGLPIEFRETLVQVTKDDGSKGTETKRVPYVKAADGTVMEMSAWLQQPAQKEWESVLKVVEGEGDETTTGGTGGESGNSQTGQTNTATMPRQTTTSGGQANTGGPKTSAAVVDRQQSKYMTPGQRRAAQQGGTKT